MANVDAKNGHEQTRVDLVLLKGPPEESGGLAARTLVQPRIPLGPHYIYPFLRWTCTHIFLVFTLFTVVSIDAPFPVFFVFVIPGANGPQISSPWSRVT
jgi:hypothetical protein